MAERRAGVIKTWNDDRGFGFISPEGGGEEVFFHIGEVRNRGVRPGVGNSASYAIGSDDRERRCAVEVRLIGRMRGGARNALIVGLGYIAALTIASVVKGASFLLPAFVALMSLIAFAAYAWDKRRAVAGGWRTREVTLHALEALGGWPGALFAQMFLRHKNRKLTYQIVFWILVVANAAASFWFVMKG